MGGRHVSLRTLARAGSVVFAFACILLFTESCVVYDKEGNVDQQATQDLNQTISQSVSAVAEGAAYTGAAFLRAREDRKRAERCSICGGSGVRACPNCAGQGFFWCSRCRGRGCFACAGYGRFTCNTCRGSGRVQCTHR